MRVWRIAKKAYALDRTGIGAMREGGRWNSMNVAVIYAGLNVEIAAFEKLVHVSGEIPDDLVLVAIDLPVDESLYWQVPVNKCPKGWDSLPSSVAAQAFGDLFIAKNQYLAMIVSSAVLIEGKNIMINPAHPAYEFVTFTLVRPFIFDSRLR